jgi:hypothetical protein
LSTYAVSSSSYIRYVLDRFDTNEANLYEISQLRAMELADQAWTDVKNSTITNCFRHAGVLSVRDVDGKPTTSSAPTTATLIDKELDHAMQLMSDNNDALVDRNIIRASAKMLVAYLLDHAEEDTTGTMEFTVKEIVEEIKSRSAEKGPGNDDDGEEEPEVTAAEALDALKVMERFSLHNRGTGVWADMSRLAKVGMRELRGQIQNARVQKGIEDYFKRA